MERRISIVAHREEKPSKKKKKKKHKTKLRPFPKPVIQFGKSEDEILRAVQGLHNFVF